MAASWQKAEVFQASAWTVVVAANGQDRILRDKNYFAPATVIAKVSVDSINFTKSSV
jgi:hypothetical protein